MKKILFLLIISVNVIYSQSVAKSKVIAYNGVEYKKGGEIEYNGVDFKIKKIYTDKKTGVLFFDLKGDNKKTIEINKEIEECNIKPCEIIPKFKYECEYTENGIDEFTNELKVFTVPKELFRKGAWVDRVYVFSGIIGDQKILRFSIQKANAFSVSENHKLIIKTEDNKTIELVNFNYNVSDHSLIGAFGNITIWTGYFDVLLDDDLIQQLKDVRVSKFRYYTSLGYVDKDVEVKNSKNISNNINCILNR